MVLLCPRVHFYEINDQTWFPQYLREKVQSCLTLAWTFRMPVMQKYSPAQLVARTLNRVLSDSITSYTYVDFCAGAGGPTPFIEADLNATLSAREPKSPTGFVNGNTSAAPKSPRTVTTQVDGPVKFVLTDLHPHIPDWTKASNKSDNLTFVEKPVDAANAPNDLVESGKVFRLYNLAFHHFDDPLAKAILKNTLQTSEGFGIFELQERTASSFLTIFCLGILMFFITPFYFWRSPGHLFFTYIIPIIPFVLVFDGYVSSLRTRSPAEVAELIRECGADSSDWKLESGHEMHTNPMGYMTWVIGRKD